jgi:hypothetical protein
MEPAIARPALQLVMGKAITLGQLAHQLLAAGTVLAYNPLNRKTTSRHRQDHSLRTIRISQHKQGRSQLLFQVALEATISLLKKVKLSGKRNSYQQVFLCEYFLWATRSILSSLDSFNRNWQFWLFTTISLDQDYSQSKSVMIKPSPGIRLAFASSSNPPGIIIINKQAKTCKI